MLGAGAGERVDRLVVVADDAEVVAVAEPVLEQRLLQQVHVLVLVDRERAVLRAERLARALVALEELHRELEQVLEVDGALGRLALLVLAVDALHQVERDRRLAAVGLGAVARDPMRRFFAHSISVARSPAGRNLNGAGSPFAIWRSTSAFDGRIVPTVSGAKCRS